MQNCAAVKQRKCRKDIIINILKCTSTKHRHFVLECPFFSAMADLYFFKKKHIMIRCFFTCGSSHMMLISFKSLRSELDIPKYFYPFKHLPCVRMGGNRRMITIST